MLKNVDTWMRYRWTMKDPDDYSINEIVDDLNTTLEEESDEKLSELEFQELMEALNTPGLWLIKPTEEIKKEDLKESL